MRERDLYEPVRQLLERDGWEIHVEIFGADIVAKRVEQILVVELKRGLTAGLSEQLHDRTRWADFVVGAVPASVWRRRDGWAYHGFGAITVNAGRARWQVRPKPQPHHWHRAKAYRLGKLHTRKPAQPYECAGLPNCPELREMRRRRDAASENNPNQETVCPDKF